MDTRQVYIAAIVIASISGGYYYYSGKAEKLAQEEQNLTYSAKGVRLTQSDEQGKLYLRASIAQAEQNIKTKSSQLEQIDAVMYRAGKIDATFKAKQGEGFNDNQMVVLKGGVLATKQSDQGLIQFSTPMLKGYPKTQLVETQSPVQVTYPRSSFTSQGLKANLNTGQYDFFHIRGQYAPNS